MRWEKSRKIKTLMYGLIGALTLSITPLPAAHATDNCFITTPYQENVWSDPLHSDAFYVRVGSVCEIKLYDLDVSFSDIDGVEGLVPIHSDENEAFSNVKQSNRGFRLSWSGSEDEREDIDYIEFSPEGSGDDLFGYVYVAPIPSLNPPITFKRNLEVTINSAHYEVNGEMRTIENMVLDSVLTFRPDNDKETLMISGIERQDVTYTSQPVVLQGDLTVEENNDHITAADLTEHYYLYDDSDLSFTPIDRPTDPGKFYLAEFTFENDHYRALHRVPFTIKDYVTVTTNIWSGHGEVSAPQYIDAGSNLHVDITPANGYEVMWVEYNGDDVTELLNDDNSLDLANVNENAYIEVAFRPFYIVTDGDGDEYALTSGQDLAFIVDKDSASYTEGMVTIMVDGNYIDLDNDSIINPATQTITLRSGYLDTLGAGEHQLKIYFFDTDVAGIARATFMVVEAETAEDSGDVVPVPNTGATTTDTTDATATESDSIETTSMAAVLSGISLAMILLLVKIIKQKGANRA